MGEGGGEIWAENGCGMPGDKKDRTVYAARSFKLWRLQVLT